MENKSIITSTELSGKQLSDVMSLYNICCDFYSTKEVFFNEPELNAIPDMPCFFMAYDGDQLVAFLSIYVPDEKSCELYGLVSPTYDDPYCFPILLEYALEMLSESDIKDISFVVDSKDTFLSEYFKADDLEAYFSTCMMNLNLDDHMPEVQESAYTFEAEFLPSEDEYTIGSYEIIIYLNDPHISRFKLGSCSFDIYSSSICLHHFYIEEKYRGIGHGTHSLEPMLAFLFNSCLPEIMDDPAHIHQIFLNVDNKNQAAYALYTHYGFKCVQQLDYYDLS